MNVHVNSLPESSGAIVSLELLSFPPLELNVVAWYYQPERCVLAEIVFVGWPHYYWGLADGITLFFNR